MKNNKSTYYIIILIALLALVITLHYCSNQNIKTHNQPNIDFLFDAKNKLDSIKLKNKMDSRNVSSKIQESEESMNVIKINIDSHKKQYDSLKILIKKLHTDEKDYIDLYLGI